MSDPGKIRLVIVDDHPVVRAGLRMVAVVDPGIEIVGEAATATEALTVINSLCPVAILLDIRLPDATGLEVCRKIKVLKDAPAVLFLTSFADNRLVLEAMEAGANGYLLKENDPRQIAAAIRSVLSGATVFDPIPTKTNVAPDLMENSEQRLVAALSPQERRVLAGVSSGKGDKEIAAALGLKTKTVRHYLDSVFEKLDVNTRTQAAVIYINSRSDSSSPPGL